jgi:hypothetical protein
MAPSWLIVGCHFLKWPPWSLLPAFPFVAGFEEARRSGCDMDSAVQTAVSTASDTAATREID